MTFRRVLFAALFLAAWPAVAHAQPGQTTTTTVPAGGPSAIMPPQGATSPGGPGSSPAASSLQPASTPVAASSSSPALPVPLPSSLPSTATPAQSSATVTPTPARTGRNEHLMLVAAAVVIALGTLALTVTPFAGR